MAVKLSLPVNKTAIEAAVNSWIDLLADGKYLDAYDFTLHDPYYAWTPDLLEQVINGYGLPYEQSNLLSKCEVTSSFNALDGALKRYREIELFDPRTHKNSYFQINGFVYYDLPINRIWSDLTTTFQILKATDYVTLELNEIHVM